MQTQISVHGAVFLAGSVLLFPSFANANDAKDAAAEFTEVRTIWDISRIADREKANIEFPNLIRFQGNWYSTFREGDIHGNHLSGRSRIIRSSDAEQWESVALMEWEGGDVRDPQLSITAEGQLMLTACVYFVSQAEMTGRRGTPESDQEQDVLRQSVTWLSADGENWGSVHACPTGVNTWRWSTTWHNGMGYSIGYAGKDLAGRLYRTRDGKRWEVLADDIFPSDGQGTETSLVFGPDDLAYCLLRHHAQTRTTMLGISRFPHTKWEWKDLGIAALGGPEMVRLSDGRLVAAGRLSGQVTLFWVDPEEGSVTEFAKAPGTSYPGVVEHEGMLWVTYEARGTDGARIELGKVAIPEGRSR